MYQKVLSEGKYIAVTMPLCRAVMVDGQMKRVITKRRARLKVVDKLSTSYGVCQRVSWCMQVCR